MRQQTKPNSRGLLLVPVLAVLIGFGFVVWDSSKSDHPSSAQVTKDSARTRENSPPEESSASDDPTECWFRKKMRVETDMNFSWLPNEERTCLVYSDGTVNARLVSCTGSDKTRNIPVGFCGEVTENVSEWKCRRDGDEFVCGVNPRKRVPHKETTNTPDEQRTIWGTDNATGRRVVSYDGGKSWQWAIGNDGTGEITVEQPQ